MVSTIIKLLLMLGGLYLVLLLALFLGLRRLVYVPDPEHVSPTLLTFRSPRQSAENVTIACIAIAASIITAVSELICSNANLLLVCRSSGKHTRHNSKSLNAFDTVGPSPDCGIILP